MKDTKTDKGKKGTTNISNSGDFKMPKNLRQIGNVNDISKVIYIEDYVISYIKQLSEKEQSDSKIAILLGKYVYNEDGKKTFIKGAVEMKSANINEGEVFTDDSWTNVYVQIKEYFSDAEIVGWAVIGLGIMLESEEKIRSMHIDNFKGPDKVILKFDNMEKEESIYIVENKQFIKQKGYYIYYEKNEELQNYMIDQNQNRKAQEEYEDIATKKIKNKIDKKDIKKSDKKTSSLTYVAGTLLGVIVLVLATTGLRNYHQMMNLESVISSISESLETPDRTEFAKGVSGETNHLPSQTREDSNPDAVDVETVQGNISQTENPRRDEEKPEVTAEKPEETQVPRVESTQTETSQPTQTEEPEESKEPETQELVETAN